MLFPFRIATKIISFPLKLIFKIFKHRLLSTSKIIIMLSGIYSLARYTWQNKEKTSMLNEKFGKSFPLLQNRYAQMKKDYALAKQEKEDKLSDEFEKSRYSNITDLHSDKKE